MKGGLLATTLAILALSAPDQAAAQRATVAVRLEVLPASSSADVQAPRLLTAEQGTREYSTRVSVAADAYYTVSMRPAVHSGSASVEVADAAGRYQELGTGIPLDVTQPLDGTSATGEVRYRLSGPQQTRPVVLDIVLTHG